MKPEIIKIKDIEITVFRKRVKHLRLTIIVPLGKVRMSIPLNTPIEIAEAFAIKKYPWIKRHIGLFEKQGKKEFTTGEDHYFKGSRFIMQVIPAKRPKIELKDEKYIYFYIPKNYTVEQKEKYYEKWLRKELQRELEILVPKWEKIMGLRANEVRIKKMKTRWGTCNIGAKRIWINLELIKRPTRLLEYIIVHELAHLRERYHNDRFVTILDKYMPNWRIYKKELREIIP